MMGEDMLGRRPGFRRYSDSCIVTTGLKLRAIEDDDHVDNVVNRVPPLHNNELTSKNVWENKIIKEEKINSFRKIDSENKMLIGECNEDEIEDDWFTKLTNENQYWFKKSNTMFNLGTDSSTYVIPLLPGKELHLKEKTMKTLRVGIKKIWKRGSATITEADPTYKVAYLGNVVTGWAKGEGCVEKPLSTTWKNYTSSTKPEVQMKITITHSGLKAVTKEYGLTEYWSNRITYCSAPSAYPRVFCWVYRHEGRKLKQELRCHSVLCSKESDARNMAITLRLRLSQALSEFKRDKILRQNARLSLANSVYDNPTLPRRKILLSTGSHVYKPPLEKSKSAPKLMAIEESIEEDEVKSNDEETMEQVLEEAKPEVSLNEKHEIKISNLSFVKKLCSSIENLVENTSVYGRKLLTERKLKEIKAEEKKKPILISKSCEYLDEEGSEYIKQRKHRKSVTFEDEKQTEDKESDEAEEPIEFKKCTDYKKQIVPVELEATDINIKPVEIHIKENDVDKILYDIEVDNKDVDRLVMTTNYRDSDCSDDSTNSLQSISSCSSDTSTQESIVVEKEQNLRRQYLNKLLSESYDNIYRTEDSKVILHPTGGKTRTTGVNPNKKYLRSLTFPQSENEKYSEEVNVDFDSLSEEDENKDEDEVVSDESGYVELAENTIKRLSLDSKEKDLPFHQIIKSNALRQRTLQSSCLEV